MGAAHRPEVPLLGTLPTQRRLFTAAQQAAPVPPRSAAVPGCATCVPGCAYGRQISSEASSTYIAVTPPVPLLYTPK